jgi:hypothetical protein
LLARHHASLYDRSGSFIPTRAACADFILEEALTWLVEDWEVVTYMLSWRGRVPHGTPAASPLRFLLEDVEVASIVQPGLDHRPAVAVGPAECQGHVLTGVEGQTPNPRQRLWSRAVEHRESPR